MAILALLSWTPHFTLYVLNLISVNITVRTFHIQLLGLILPQFLFLVSIFVNLKRSVIQGRMIHYPLYYIFIRFCQVYSSFLSFLQF